jgi:hypothetical protein
VRRLMEDEAPLLDWLGSIDSKFPILHACRKLTV